MGIPVTMRALQQTSLNGPQDLRLITDAPVPGPGPGEVLVRVTAAGVNFGDISQAHGTFLGGPPPPYLAGFEAAGEIAAVGEAVTGLEPGARVIGAGIGSRCCRSARAATRPGRAAPFAGDQLPDVVCLKYSAGTVYPSRPTELARYWDILNQLAPQADPPIASTLTIEQMRRKL
jgi:NADPH:quinone reductase-like Zn-dependent oxidoreductase